MKRSIHFFALSGSALILLMPIPAMAQLSNMQQKIAAIKKECKRINVAALTQKSIGWHTPCGVKSAVMTFCYDKGKLVKIMDKGTGDDDKTAAKWNIEHYYKNSKIIFTYEISTRYDNEQNKTVTTQTRKYYVDDLLIRTVEGKQITDYTVEMVTGDNIVYKLYRAKDYIDISTSFGCE